MNKRELKKILSSVKTQVVADQSWKAKQRENLLTTIKSQVGTRPAVSFFDARVLSRLGVQVLRPVGAFGVAFVLVFGGVMASVNASGTSLPGDFLYTLKLTSEKVHVSLVSDKTNKANLQLSFAKKRIEEITEVVKRSHNTSETQEKIKKPLESYRLTIASVKMAIEESKNDGDGKAIVLAEQLKEVAASAAVSVKTTEVTKVAQDTVKVAASDSVKKAIAEVLTTSTDAQLSVIKLTAVKDLPKAKEELVKYLADTRKLNEEIINPAVVPVEDVKVEEVAPVKEVVEARAVVNEPVTNSTVNTAPTNTVVETEKPIEEPAVKTDEQKAAEEAAAKKAEEDAARIKSDQEAAIAKAKVELEKITKAEALLKKDDVLGAIAVMMGVEPEPVKVEATKPAVTNEPVDASTVKN